jgi:ribosomal protein S18 acetylase RimI-like enzyme
MKTIRRAIPSDIHNLMSICRRYHAFEELECSDADREVAVLPLLEDHSLGCILVSQQNSTIHGYIALCLGYSIELGGREAFIDEFFVDQEWRGRGVGDALLAAAVELLADWNIVALHLEVARDNLAAQEFYSKRGFEARNRYFLMSHPLGKNANLRQSV